MNLRVNNVNFSGKTEILYGLKKAAKISQSMEYTKKAYISSRLGMSKLEEMTAYEASMRAYLDMAVHDSEFVNVINHSLTQEDIKSLKNIVKPQVTEHGTIEPLNDFYSTAKDVTKRKEKDIKEAIKNLCNLLK